MIVVPIKEGDNIERALKKLKRKFEKTGVVKELRERQKFTKPSVINRERRLKAIPPAPHRLFGKVWKSCETRLYTISSYLAPLFGLFCVSLHSNLEIY